MSLQRQQEQRFLRKFRRVMEQTIVDTLEERRRGYYRDFYGTLCALEPSVRPKRHRSCRKRMVAR